MRPTNNIVATAVVAACVLFGAGSARAQGLNEAGWDVGPGRRWQSQPPSANGAWEVTHQWGEPISAEPDAPTYADAYVDYVREHADEWVGDQSRKRDCADFSISLMIDYASEKGLPVELRVYFSTLRRFVTASSTERRFRSKQHFDEWARWHMGAMNLADNTYPVTYETWRPGDMVLMDWGQTETWPNFPGRVVWHTYLVGEPGETAYYGNITGDEPLPIAKITSASQIRDRLMEHPDRFGLSPRRWRFMNAPRLPFPEPEPEVTDTGAVNVSRANVRAGPGTNNRVVTGLSRGDEVEIIGEENGWLQLRLGDDETAWIYGRLIDRDETVGQDARVTVSVGNVRGGPSTSNTIVDRVTRGDTVRVLARRGDWLRLQGEPTRWVHESLVDLSPPVAAIEAPAPSMGLIGALGDDD